VEISPNRLEKSNTTRCSVYSFGSGAGQGGRGVIGEEKANI
jgi:hypothetical protein